MQLDRGRASRGRGVVSCVAVQELNLSKCVIDAWMEGECQLHGRAEGNCPDSGYPMRKKWRGTQPFVLVSRKSSLPAAAIPLPPVSPSRLGLSLTEYRPNDRVMEKAESSFRRGGRLEEREGPCTNANDMATTFNAMEQSCLISRVEGRCLRCHSLSMGDVKRKGQRKYALYFISNVAVIT